ncbi:unnamed protein product [Psylliodes chrysocephalus]|uniref:BESS domain-containing protein n=1 Tax=Psylliodes chrysocephalus TaxID=3402493 RepID=A0A9P0CZH6_9CUCU|nr:unnamed protein product [Psylliodes chrysocephala]
MLISSPLYTGERYVRRCLFYTTSNIEEESQESNDEAVSDADHNLVEETQSTIIDLEQSSIATPSTSSVASTCTPVRAHKRKMIDSISKLLEENKKAREKIVEIFLEKTNVPQEDDVDVFYRSIALSVKRLPPHLIAKTKLRHLETVNELQLLASQPNDLPQQQNRSSLNSCAESQWQGFNNNQDQYDQLRYLNLD